MDTSKLIHLPLARLRGAYRGYTALALCALLLGACSSETTPAIPDTQEVINSTPDTSNETPSETPQQAPALGMNPERINTRVACDATGGEIQSAMLQLINEFRTSPQSCGNASFPAAAALSWNSTLEQAASTHSVDMADHNFFSHTGSDGSSASDRIAAAGYNWAAAGENIAAGQQDAEAAVEAWKNSAGHCANLMNSSFKEIAVSCRKQSGTDFTNYWTLVLGTAL